MLTLCTFIKKLIGFNCSIRSQQYGLCALLKKMGTSYTNSGVRILCGGITVTLKLGIRSQLI